MLHTTWCSCPRNTIRDVAELPADTFDADAEVLDSAPADSVETADRSTPALDVRSGQAGQAGCLILVEQQEVYLVLV
jgi:hypothetical protein